ncbi:MAG: family 78 glycoside hydrolase catalytic domain [Firmicutes bacterium]|nr:family 78 glycoside hydrolase catalytic domain [Bacillota bacterium]
MPLTNSMFIEYPSNFDSQYKKEDPAPLFRRRFNIDENLIKAELCVCGLGYGKYYINEESVTEDLFIAPVSDYNKTLWYNCYDLTEKMRTGTNVIAVILGNGYYNEAFKTAWNFNEATWRDNLKFALSLKLTYKDKTEVIESDEEWKCNNSVSRVRYDNLRSGEYWDFRYPEKWYAVSFDDSYWENARFAKRIPSGCLRECLCQPIRERRHYTPINAFENREGGWVIDFGQNMSGYVRISLKQKSGDIITIKYTEELNDDGTRKTNHMDDNNYYPESDFQTDRFICSGEVDTFKPMFVYHGFRYIIIEGLSRKPDLNEIEAIFVCQAVNEISSFNCSDEIINKLDYMGKTSSLSNMFYMLTDCPTREKLGWCNDARASTEQMLQNFDIVPLFKKWLIDIYDSVKEDGSMPGIVPTAGWGYAWGSGPISNSILFEIPYKVYRYYDDASLLTESLQCFKKYLDYLDTHLNDDGLVAFGLCDWAGPFETPQSAPTPLEFTDTVLATEFYKIAKISAELSKRQDLANEFEEKYQSYKNALITKYIDKDSGRCNADEQTAVAMLIVNDLYDDFDAVKQQLKSLIEKHKFHHNCGMLGIQYLFFALNKCNLQEYAYKVITAADRPSYREWIDNGATTMWEMWNTGESKNHHMYSGLLSWFNRTIAGLNLNPNENGYKNAVIKPYFFKEIENCASSYNTCTGEFKINWEKISNNEVELDLTVPDNAVLDVGEYTVSGKSTNRYELTCGRHKIICKK